MFILTIIENQRNIQRYSHVSFRIETFDHNIHGNVIRQFFNENTDRTLKLRRIDNANIEKFSEIQENNEEERVKWIRNRETSQQNNMELLIIIATEIEDLGKIPIDQQFIDLQQINNDDCIEYFNFIRRRILNLINRNQILQQQNQ